MARPSKSGHQFSWTKNKGSCSHCGLKIERVKVARPVKAFKVAGSKQPIGRLTELNKCKSRSKAKTKAAPKKRAKARKK